MLTSDQDHIFAAGVAGGRLVNDRRPGAGGRKISNVQIVMGDDAHQWVSMINRYKELEEESIDLKT